MPNGYMMFHLNLAFSSIPVEARLEVIRSCYWPLLKFVEGTGIPVGVELTGWTLREISDRDPSWVAQFRQLLHRQQCELIGSGWAQLIGPLVPYEVNRWNQRLGLQAYEDVLDVAPEIALVNEMAFSTGMVNVYAEAGYRGILMDRDNVRLALELDQQPLSSTPTHAQGSADVSLPVLWADSVLFQRFQRVVHGDIPISEYLAYAKQRAEHDDTVLPIYCNDAEIFDYRPGRFTAESRPHPEGEWERLRRVSGKLKDELSLEWLSPSKALDSLVGARKRKAARMSSVSHPIPVKKQAKYNVNRWAVAGRDDLWLNTTCHRIHQVLMDRRDEAPENWKELCSLWASDLRTHITDTRWAETVCLVAAAVTRIGVRPLSEEHFGVATCSEVSHQFVHVERDEDGILWTITTPFIRIVLNVRRGLTISSLAFKSHDFKPILGTLPQGYFTSIELSADYYSGGVLIEIPGERQRLTDLEWVTPHVEEREHEIVVSAVLALGKRTLKKSVSIGITSEHVRLGYDFRECDRPLGIVRVGILTLLSEAFRTPLTLACSNGGRVPESFVLDRDVDHGRAVSPMVSSSSAFGATEGTLSVTDALGRGFSATWNCGQCAAVPLLKHQQAGERSLTRVSFSLVELDDTSRAGGRLLPFVCELQAL